MAYPVLTRNSSPSVKAAVALACCLFVQQAAAAKDDFPLVWLCLGLTLVGIAVAFFITRFRPMDDDDELPPLHVKRPEESPLQEQMVRSRGPHSEEDENLEPVKMLKQTSMLS